MKLIDGDELIELLLSTAITDKQREYSECVQYAVQKMPPVDAVPVQHGRWITHHEKVALLNGEAFGGVYCSECGFKTHNKMHLILGCPFKYCPNCGARMDGKGTG